MTSDFARRAYGSFGRLGPGSRIAGYLVEEQIGAGGMAVVFRARDEVLSRLAAVKFIAPSMADDEGFRARFLRESRAAAAVDSPHIIPVFGAGEAEGLLYIATRFVTGGDLAALVRRAGGRLTADRTAGLVSQVASALDAAHTAGLVHRDVKTQNILVDSVPGRPEHAYLCDFGLSKGTHSTGLTATGQFLGTPDYSAPEQIRGAYVDGRADQYALGCVAFVLLTGTLPFRRDETVATLFAHLQDPVPPVTRLRPDLPPAVDGVIARALAKSPGDRYDRCGEFAAALGEALAPAGSATVPVRGGPALAPAPTSAEPGRALGRARAAGRGLGAGHDLGARPVRAPGRAPGAAGPAGRAGGPGNRRRPRWTRNKALALAGAAAVACLAAFGTYEYLPGAAATTAATGNQGTMVYYADGETLLGTFGASGRPAQAQDPWAPYLMTQVRSELTGIDGVTQQELKDGGLKVVTTVSRAMEVQLYQAVSENLNPRSIESTPGATVPALPAWALVGAELQDPKNGEILAEYPGKGQDLPAAQCKAAECDENTAAYTREQPGSSFKPYVLAAAVARGLNVKTSTLNASPELCVPPDTRPMALSTVVPYGTRACAQPDYFAVSNDGGEVIGNPEESGGTTVQNALAQSSDTAFADLAHRVGTARIAALAGRLGVNVAPYKDGGSGLSDYTGQVGLSLGIAPLTVNEQTEMLATIAGGGVYHQAHVVRYWQQGAGGARRLPKVGSHVVLNPGLNAQVQYAMEDTTINGTAAAAVTYGQRAVGTVIGKSGTTATSHSGFFLGATTQYALVVGMFTSAQNLGSGESLSVLGGGSGGYWPAKIWNTFAKAEFPAAPARFPTSPAFTGAGWDQVGQGPAGPTGAVSQPTGTQPTATPGAAATSEPAATPKATVTPEPTCSYQGQASCVYPSPSPTPTPS